MRIVFREADANRCNPGRNRPTNSQKSSVAADNQPPKLVWYEKSRLGLGDHAGSIGGSLVTGLVCGWPLYCGFAPDGCRPNRLVDEMTAL